jgi:hypothetical protein
MPGDTKPKGNLAGGRWFCIICNIEPNPQAVASFFERVGIIGKPLFFWFNNLHGHQTVFVT